VVLAQPGDIENLMAEQATHMTSSMGGTYRMVLETLDSFSRPLFVLAMLLIVLQRTILSDIQLDWDEEWYFQIAHAWKRGLVPYRDIFDHKPPMVYVFYMLTSWGTHLFVTRLAATCLLIGSVMQMFGALQRAGYITDRQFLFLVPALCCFMSLFVGGVGSNTELIYAPLSFPSFGLLLDQQASCCSLWQVAGGGSSNTEMIYAPLVLFSFGLLLDRRLYWSATCAALAIAIKYSVIADIFGVAVLYWFISRDRNQRTSILLVWALRVLVFSTVVYLAFYIYFGLNGVNLVKQIFLLNLKHASSTSASLFGYGSGLKWFLIDAAEATALFAVFCSFRKPSAYLLKGAILWLFLSVVQGCLTRQYYPHYFIPAFAPLTLVWASFRFREAMLPILLLCIAVIQCDRIHASYQWLTWYQDAVVRYRSVCEIINNRGYITTTFLAGYRVCESPSVDKFAFPPFYLDEHFAAISGTGGLTTLRGKIQAGEIVSLISFRSQVEGFRSSLEIGADRIRVMSDQE
jgi:hypothetical protein